MTESNFARTRLAAVAVAVSCLGSLVVGVAGAQAAFGVAGTTASIAGDASGAADTQAGSHPYSVSVGFSLTTATPANGVNPLPDGQAKDINVELPPGLIGNPTGIPECTSAQMAVGGCPADTQVGSEALTWAITYGGLHTSPNDPVYNMVPPPGDVAEFGFRAATDTILITATVRSGGDYGITMSLTNIPEAIAIYSSDTTFWGEPTGTTTPYVPGTPLPVGATAPDTFLTLPTQCSGRPLTASVSADPWSDPGNFSTSTATFEDGSGNPETLTGCDQLDFNPSLSVQPDTSSADSPSGLNVDLSFPQDGVTNPWGTAEANLQNATVTLPSGMTVDPSAAGGLTGCSPAQIGINDASAPDCPDSSKVGTVQISTPLLPDRMIGGIYVAQQDNNPFNSLVAIYVTAYADGVWIKLPGKITLNPVTGQLETSFSTNPQLPFSSLDLSFFGGSHGILATPQQCGTYTTSSDLSPWSGGGDSTPSDSFVVGSGCVGGFGPSFTAGAQNPQAGAYSSFAVSFARSDSDQNLSGLSVRLPPGMLAKLAGVQECSDAELAAAAARTGAQEQAAPSCPSGSQVGTVQTAAGVGPDPFSLSGQAYLTGPYKGAPYGLAVVVPAVAGPYDLGTVVVRQALFIDPETAQVTVVSDPFPTILQGIPLDLRRVDVDLNRPGFTVNPTSCDPMAVTGTLSSTGGLSENVSDRFQVGGCQDIGFSPKLAIALSGNGKTQSGDHPALTATLTDPSGQANIKTARVALPLSLALDPTNSEHVCGYATAQAVHGGAVGCPASTIVGTASVVTPLLSQPLTGKVYLVQGIRFSGGRQIKTLPSLLIPLRGQIALDLRAQSSVNGGGALITTFSTIPDAPVSKFVLQITGGPKGLLVITGRGRSICAKAQVSNATLGAQSGKSAATKLTLATPCGKPASGLRAAVKHATVRVRVHVPGAGKLTASGPSLRRQVKHPRRAQTMTLSLGLTKTARQRLNHKGHLQTRVTVNWTPAGGGTHPMHTRTLTIRP